MESYLHFTVSDLSGVVQSAKIRIHVTSNGTNNGPAIHTVDAGWSETGITWNNRSPRTSGAIANLGAMAANGWAEYDVTPVVTGNGTYHFALVADSADGVRLSSREGSDPPAADANTRDRPRFADAHILTYQRPTNSGTRHSDAYWNGRRGVDGRRRYRELLEQRRRSDREIA